MRIAVGGFQIESCTFSPLLARGDDFQILRGDALLNTYQFRRESEGIEAVPLVRARALPGGPVETSFYEAIKAELVQGLAEKGPWDGVFLHLHGAAYVVGMKDAEGDLVAAVRQAVGPECLVAASYDLHGNLSKRVVDNLDIVSAYRTAPHTDTYETLERVWSLLVTCIREVIRPCKAFVPVPILLPGERTSTHWEPAASLYGLLPEVAKQGEILDASILVGYAWADEPRSAASVIVLGTDGTTAQRAASTLAERFWDARHEFQAGMTTGSTDECIIAAMASPERPVVISDSGDNPTAGAPGDDPYVLERLLALGVPDAVYASLPDAAAVEICQQMGVGARVELMVGGKLDPVHSPPLQIEGRLLTIKDHLWSVYDTGAYRSSKAAVVQVQGVRVILTADRVPFHRVSDLRNLGIEPENHRIIVVKLGYLEPELDALAARSLLALSPGAVHQAIESLPFERVQRPIYPLDPAMSWAPPMSQVR